VCDELRAGHPPSRDTVVLTFDDGLRNNLTYAVPLLARYRAPATFFVVPGLIEKREWLWTHEMSVRLQFTDRRELSRLSALASSTNIPGPAATRLEWARTVVEQMKKQPEDDRLRTLADLRRFAPGLLAASGLADRYELMRWDELHSLDEELIEIGSHSTSHPLLEGLSDERLTHEIAGSRDALAAALGRPVVSFCYPNGRFDQSALELVRRHYDQAVAANEGRIDRQDLHRLPRLFVSDATDTRFRLARGGFHVQSETS
jgi:peptidoglycan/xylan/chitin deacetylase (PgdA/CDA1 family)